MAIPLSKPFVDKDDELAVKKTLRSGWLTQGPQVQSFEEEVCNLIDTPNTIAVSNCTCALSLALEALGIGEGDFVICPSLSFIATANSIRNIGAEPFFCDVDEVTLNLSPSSVREAIDKHFVKVRGVLESRKIKGKKLAAILVVHQFGNPAPLEEFLKIRRDFGLTIIEDAACALGTQIRYRGSLEYVNANRTDAACFSLHPRKVITCGEGGFITTKNRKLTKDLRKLRHHGMSLSDRARHQSKKYVQERYVSTGYNYRLSDLSAALAGSQLRKLPKILQKYQKNFEQYVALLRGNKNIEVLDGSAFGLSNRQSIYARIRDPRLTNPLIDYMREKEIYLKRGIQPAHLERPYLKSFHGDLRVTEQIATSDILLPQFYNLRPAEIREVCAGINSFFK